MLPLVPSPRGGEVFWNLSFPSCSFLGVFEPETFPVSFDDVDSVGDAVELRSGEPLVDQNLCPFDLSPFMVPE
jgi:hypothetical protein